MDSTSVTPVAYVSAAPGGLKAVGMVEEMLYETGWSPQRSPSLLTGQTRREALQPTPKLVGMCLSQLRRTDVMVSVGRWRGCEMCRIEWNFARDNNIVCTEANEQQCNIPEAATFGEKFMKVRVTHCYLHAHPTKGRALA